MSYDAKSGFSVEGMEVLCLDTIKRKHGSSACFALIFLLMR